MNETELLNATANETVKGAAQQGGAWSFDLIKSVDLLLNNGLTEGLAGILNTTFNTHIFSGTLIVGLVVILTAWWKWNSVVQFIGTIGGYVLATAAGYLILKSVGVF